MSIELVEARRKQAVAAMAALPEVIQVGSHQVVIMIRDRFHTTRDLLGQYDSDAQVITLSAELQTPQKVAETFIHEVNHAIYYQAGLEDSDAEERIVNNMSLGLMNVFRDNPWYPKWIAKYTN